MAWGDLIMRMMGEQDPAAQLQAALGQGPGQPGGAPGVATSGPPVAPQAPPQGPMPNGAPVPAPQAPPQPQAYTSPPDLVSLYTKLQERQDRNASIDRGIGLLFSAFAQPENRAAMIASMSGGQKADPANQIDNLMKLQSNQQDLQRKAQLRASLPDIAKKYHLDLQTATYLLESGGLDNYIQQAAKPEHQSALVDTYEYYKLDEIKAGREPKGFDEWSKSAAAEKARTKFSLGQPVYIPRTDEKGEITLHSYQLADDGTMKEIKDDKGNSVAVKPLKIQTDTEIILQNPYTHEEIGRIPKNVEEGARQRKAGGDTGEAMAAARTGLPNAENTTKIALEQIDAITDSPALNDEWFKGGALGMSGTVMRKIPGSDAYGLDQRIMQAKAKAFSDAYEALKGTGSITEIEGIKAEAARQRMDAAQNPTDFKKALKDYREVLLRGLEIARKRAKGEFDVKEDSSVDIEKERRKNDAPGPDEDDADPDVGNLVKKYGR